MKAFRITLAAGLVLALSSSAWAVPFSVPLPSPGDMLVTAWDVYGEVFLEVTGPNNTLGPGGAALPVGMYNNVGVGFSKNVDGAGTPGYVLYQGGLAHVGAAPDLPVPANPNAKILAVAPYTGSDQNVITQLFTGNLPGNPDVIGRLYAVGRIYSISRTAPPPTDSKVYWDGTQSPGNPQLTFVMYNAYVESMEMGAMVLGPLGYAQRTQYVLNSDESKRLHVDMYADPTPDALVNLQGNPGQRYQSYAAANAGEKPELPLRDATTGTLLVNPNTGTYYDSVGGWGWLDFAGNPADDDAIMWSFVGSDDPLVRDQFAFSQVYNIGAGDEGYTLPYGGNNITFYPGSTASLDPEFPQLVPGNTLNTGKGTLKDGLYYGFYNDRLVNSYEISSNLRSGARNTGAEASDPLTFTFQLPPGANNTPRLAGELVVPEPLTMLSLLLATGCIGGYVRRRRAA